jgi:hypothetical protein
MIDHMKRACRFSALMVSVPAIVGFIGAWSAGAGFLLFILCIPAALLMLLVGLVVVTVRGVKLPLHTGSKRERALVVGIGPVLLAATLLAAVPLLRAGSFVGDLTRLMVNHRHYEAIIAKAAKQREAEWYADDGGVTYSTDLGPPIRVAFNPAGMLDNWSGIIYDRTGDVMLAKGFDSTTGKFYAPDKVTKLFGGDLVGCRHLWGSYYSCSFT